MSRPGKLLLSLSVLLACVAVPEAVLRGVGFRYGDEPVIQFGWPRPQHLQKMVLDPDLFWRLAPQPGFANSEGFPSPGGREVEEPKPDGHYRMLFFGDSVTFGGYPAFVERNLAEARAGDGLFYESVALAVAGYSSFQGRRCAELYAERYEPDLAVVYFGWNDHWRARGTIDSEKVMPMPAEEGGGGAASWLRESSRLVQGLTWLRDRTRRAGEVLDQPRVPIDEYRENLRAIHERVAAQGAPLVFVTAPTSYYDLGVAKELTIELGLVASEEEAIQQHRAYNQVVREVALETGALLLDLEERFEGLPEIAEVFRRDGIHFTPEGRELLARHVSDFLLAEVLDR